MIKNILDVVTSEPSTKNKIKLLKEHKDNELLKRVIHMGVSKRINYYIKKNFPEYTSNGTNTISLEKALDDLIELSSRKVTGNDAISFLENLLSNMSEDDAIVIERIVKKKLKIGMDAKNINKAIPHLLEVTPYQGAKSYSEKLVLKLLDSGVRIKSDIKKDGQYGNATIDNGCVEIVSRQGETIYINNSKLFSELEKLPNMVLNGELLINGISRQVSNGIINSLTNIGEKISNDVYMTDKLTEFQKDHGITYQEALDKLEYYCWDTISIEDYLNISNNEKYSVRWDRLINIISGNKLIHLVDHIYITTFEEAMKHFLDSVANGEEGTILKSMDGVWKNTKPSYQIKFKLEMNVDLRIIGFKYGEKGSKNEHVISTLLCESSDGLLLSNPSGMDEKMMKRVTNEQDILLNTIVEVRSCGMSQNRKGGYSLMHPSVVELRSDKDTCDDLESIIEIETMSKELTIKSKK